VSLLACDGTDQGPRYGDSFPERGLGGDLWVCVVRPAPAWSCAESASDGSASDSCCLSQRDQASCLLDLLMDGLRYRATGP
jgi:hypothetical protein